MNANRLARLASTALLAASLSAVAACSGQSPSGTTPEQLEALAVSGEQGYDPVQHQGKLTVAGVERDYQLTIAEAAKPVTLGVHTPGMSDLATLDGRTVTATLEAAGLDGERSLVLSDDQGAAYLASVGHGLEAETTRLFGSGFARWGDTIGTSRDDSYDWEYTPAVFATDTGDVAVDAGETATLTLRGATWRVAVIAAYKVTPHPDAALPCGGISSLLSYEMLRVEVAPPAVKLVRPSSAKLAHLGCME